MTIIIKQETKKDYSKVYELIKLAFEPEQYSDHQEHHLVERLRSSKAFMPELSMVAEIDNKTVGHILLTRITINNESQTCESLALAPVSVLPKFQGEGVGKKLITSAHDKALSLGFKSIILLGHQDYYPRFGYKQLDGFGITLPFDVPNENCMAIELVKGSLKEISGIIEYAKEFG